MKEFFTQLLLKIITSTVSKLLLRVLFSKWTVHGLRALLVAAPGIVSMLTTGRVDNATFLLIVASTTIIASTGYWIISWRLSKWESRHREEKVTKLRYDLERSLSEVFADVLRKIASHVDRLNPSSDPKDLRDLLLGLALDRIYQSTNKSGDVGVRVTFLQPMPDNPRMLEITHWNQGQETPRAYSSRYRFQLADSECREITTAGYTWAQWQAGGSPHVVISSVRSHLEFCLTKPREKRFHLLYEEEADKIKSLVCCVVYYRSQYRVDRGDFLGILCLDSSCDTFFSESGWTGDLLPRIKPFIRLIEIAIILDRALKSLLSFARAERTEGGRDSTKSSEASQTEAPDAEK